MNKFFKIISELKKTPRGRAALFFGGYFFFFLILIIFLRVGNHSSNYNDNVASTDTNTVSFRSIMNNNYSFSYTVFLDDNKFEYLGERDGNNSVIKYLDNTFYKMGDKYYDDIDNVYQEIEDPIKFSLFLEDKNFDLLKSNSYYESKTEYENSFLRYDYLISTNTINSLFHNTNSDFLEEANRIIYSTDSNSDVYKINYVLDSYCMLNNLCDKTLKIELIYDNFGKVSEIDNQIKNS